MSQPCTEVGPDSKYLALTAVTLRYPGPAVVRRGPAWPRIVGSAEHSRVAIVAILLALCLTISSSFRLQGFMLIYLVILMWSAWVMSAHAMPAIRQSG